MRMWEIRENDEYRYGRRGHSDMRDDDMSYDEAYEKGFEDGYAKAMKEVYKRR